MNIAKKSIDASKKIFAADDDFDAGFDDPGNFDDGFDDADDDVQDSLDDVQDTLDDVQDTLEDITEDDPNIETDNNIDGHYIAECEKCHGVFISAIVESDQEVTSIHGTCPLCEQDTEQYLKWIVKKV